LVVAEGEKGPRIYDWACQRIVESHEQLPGPKGRPDSWLLARRSVSDPNEIAYYLSNAPTETDLLTLAQVASTRYTMEQCIEEAKGETGLDHYEVRYWHSWYRHITFSMMAHAWLASIRLKHTQEKGGLNPSWPRPVGSRPCLKSGACSKSLCLCRRARQSCAWPGHTGGGPNVYRLAAVTIAVAIAFSRHCSVNHHSCGCSITLVSGKRKAKASQI